MPLIETKGAASAQGFGEFAQQTAPIYIEDVFSTWLYTGNGSTQTITNGIDLSTKGGLVWIKDRTSANPSWLYDTNRGTSSGLQTSNANAAFAVSTAVTAFNSNGFALGTNGNSNTNNNNYASWTFRKQPKFFDVVTYTGNGANRTISHNLGSVPGCIIVKRTDAAADWQVYHRSLANTQYLVLNTTAAVATGTTRWNSTTPTSTVFSLGTDSTVNASGGTYVAYLFAHNAGGFGLSGTNNVISCGSFTTTGLSASVNLGYEPQWVLIKYISNTGGYPTNWLLIDNMRGWPAASSLSGLNTLAANSNGAEAPWSGGGASGPTATGFKFFDVNSATNTDYIYIAIRRGPMKTPTSGTSVFSPIAATGGSTFNNTFSSLSYIDLVISFKNRNVGSTYNNPMWNNRLTGFPIDMTGATYTTNPGLASSVTDAEGTGVAPVTSNYLSGVTMNRAVWGGGWTGYLGVFFGLKRAPGFFDVVCYTGDGDYTYGQLINHNLGVDPELLIGKPRSTSGDWRARWNVVGYVMNLNSNVPYSGTTLAGGFLSGTGATTFAANPYAGDASTVNASGVSYIAFLFASCPGVSKVGYYTGTGALQTIDCGFTGGARFVLIKRTDSTGDWYVYDSARGISSGNDPYLLLNSAAAEVTGTNYVDTTSVGFQVTAAAPAGLNASGGSYIFLAIA